VRDAARLQFRTADAADADAIGALHAESWRRNYRGAYSDAYLDGDVVSDRAAVWRDRLRGPGDGRVTIVAEHDGGLVGFAHTILDDDSTWGALLDNLHVISTRQRRGIGTHLLGLSARAVVERAPGSGLYLWVLEQNVKAQAFYEALGGRRTERAEVTAPGGDPARLHGVPMKLRYVWLDPATLIGVDRDAPQ
jgi:ribosomal protein S18 acetylase RimI-like enzyme